MKKKEIKKLIKVITNTIREEIEMQSFLPCDKPLTYPKNDIDYIEYNEEISNKFFKFACNIIKLKDKINLVIKDDYIVINGSLDGKSSSSFIFGQSNNIFSQPDDYLDIYISKDGFSISRAQSSRISYEDKNILEKLKIDLRERNKFASKDTIINIIDDILVKMNLARENNLEEILDQNNNI